MERVTYLWFALIPGLQCFRSFSREPAVLTRALLLSGLWTSIFFSPGLCACQNPCLDFKPLSSCFALGVSSFALCLHSLLSIDKCPGENWVWNNRGYPLGVSFTQESWPLIFWRHCIPIVVFSAHWDFSGLPLSFNSISYAVNWQIPQWEKSTSERKTHPIAFPFPLRFRTLQSWLSWLVSSVLKQIFFYPAFIAVLNSRVTSLLQAPLS